MAKITADFHKKMEAKIPKTKTITLTAEGEEYEIVIKNFLSLEEKAELLTEVINIITADYEIDEKGGATILLMYIYKALTDIEFPEGLEDQISQFTWLLDTGILKGISENLRESLVEELSLFLTLSLEQAQKLVEENNPR